MKVGNILQTAAFLSGNAKLSEKIKNVLEDSDVFSDEEKEEVDKLIACYNITVSELSGEFVPLYYKEDFSVKDNKIYFKDFTKTPLEIKSVYRSVIPQKFKVYPTYVKVETDHCTVEYVYRVKEVNSIEDECELSGSIIPERVIAEGVVSESLINAGMYQEALLWRDRYEKSVKNCLLKRKVERIKTRIWF